MTKVRFPRMAFYALILPIVLPIVALLVSASGAFAQTATIVTFPTEDGVTIQGTLHLPQATAPKVPGIVLLAEPEWVVRATLDTTNLGPELVKKYGMAVLTLDFRGNGKSGQGKLFRTYSHSDLDKLQLDVRGAIKYLSSQKIVDTRRIGVVGVGIGAEYAIREADENPAVQALVLISGSLSDRAKEYIKTRSDVPILCLAGKDDKEGIVSMAEAFALSKNKDSNIILAETGHGTGMFTRVKGLSEQVTEWLAQNVKGVGIETDIHFVTQDGWDLHGKVTIPDGLSDGAKVPGVVLVHGANHDQDTYYDLNKALVKKGFATITFDWRGKNRDASETRGHYGVSMNKQDSENFHLDTKAALNFFASQKGVDASRIGLISATAGTNYAMEGVLDDNRVKAMVMLTQYVPTDKVKKFLATSDTPVFFVASTEDLNFAVGSLAEYTKTAARLSKSKETEFLLYDDAGRGSEMMKKKDELQGMIVRWFSEKLAK